MLAIVLIWQVEKIAKLNDAIIFRFTGKHTILYNFVILNNKSCPDTRSQNRQLNMSSSFSDLQYYDLAIND